MTERFLPYGRQTIEQDDIDAVAEALRSDFLTTGPRVEAFERAAAEISGAREAVAVNSGTAALHVAYAAAGVGPGTEVVTTPLTFASTANVALHLGATVRFVDVDPETALMDPASLEGALNERTRAVVPIDYAGAPADYDAIREVIGERPIDVIGDSSHSIGATYKGRRVGTLCPACTISLHPVKSITTGEGGLVLTDNAEWAAAMRRFRHHGVERGDRHALASEGPWAYSMTELGLNYRITDFQCALGLTQLAKLDRFLARRREIAAAYDRELAGVPGIRTPVVADTTVSGWHLYVVRVDDHTRRRAFFEKLRELGIGAQVHYLPVYWHPYYEALGFTRGLCPKAEGFYRSAVSLPIFPTMTDEDVTSAVERVRDAARGVV